MSGWRLRLDRAVIILGAAPDLSANERRIALGDLRVCAVVTIERQL